MFCLALWVGWRGRLTDNLPLWSWGSVAGQGMDFPGKSRSCTLFCFLERWSALVLMSFQDLLCNPAIVCFINTSTLYSRVVVYLLRHLFAWKSFLMGSSRLRIWEVLAGKETTWHCSWVCVPPHYCWMGSSQGSCCHHLLPFAFWQMSWILANYFSAPGKTLICKYSFLKIQYLAVGSTLNFLVMFNLEKFWLFFLEF